MNADQSSIKETNCLFQQPWWLDALLPGQWRVVTVERGGRIVARMPYVERRKYGMKIMSMPPLTQTLGPWIAELDGKYDRRLGQEYELITALVEKLPRYDYFSQNLHYSIQSWLPFYWKGFQETTRYTYILRDLKDIDALWSNCSESTRRAIRKGRRQLEIREGLNIDNFLELNRMTFLRQGMRLPYSEVQVRRLDKACRERHCHKIMYAVDSNERIHAAIFLVWDHRSAYYLMGGSDPELRSGAGMSALLWAAIKHSAERTQEFNFEGSILAPIERFFRGFGGQLIPYQNVMGMSRRMKLLKAAYDGAAAVRK